MTDYYKILNIRRDATLDEVRNAYRVLSMSWNPVKNNNSEEAANMFQTVAEAYDVLSTPQYRGIYDLRGSRGLSEENYVLSRTPEKIFSKFFGTSNPFAQVTFSSAFVDEETKRFHAMHHPFTSPKEEDFDKLETAPGEVRANAYDLCMNGVELGGGSIRIYDKALQERMFDLLGFSKEEAKEQFGFLMNAFEYGAPPHGGLAFGFDRICAMLGGQDSIRDFIAFPKNNSGRDVMIDSPSLIDDEQLKELSINLVK